MHILLVAPRSRSFTYIQMKMSWICIRPIDLATGKKHAIHQECRQMSASLSGDRSLWSRCRQCTFFADPRNPQHIPMLTCNPRLLGMDRIRKLVCSRPRRSDGLLGLPDASRSKTAMLARLCFFDLPQEIRDMIYDMLPESCLLLLISGPHSLNHNLLHRFANLIKRTGASHAHKISEGPQDARVGP